MNIDHNTKENILDAAKAEFALHGFSGARLAVIAENSGVNKALIHYYFKSKHLLYENVWESFFTWDDESINIPIYLQSNSFTIVERLYLYVYITVSLNIKFTDEKILEIFLWELAEGGKFLKSFHDKYFFDRHKSFYSILQAGHKEGLFDLQYADLIVMGIFAVNFFYKIGKNRGTQRSFKMSYEGYKDEDEKFLSYTLEYVFKMLSPLDKPIPVPQIKPEILEYINELLHMNSNKISILTARRIVEFLCQDLN